MTIHSALNGTVPFLDHLCRCPQTKHRDAKMSITIANIRESYQELLVSFIKYKFAEWSILK